MFVVDLSVVAVYSLHVFILVGFFFQAEDGIRDAQESRGLGDVYKRQLQRDAAAKLGAVLSG